MVLSRTNGSENVAPPKEKWKLYSLLTCDPFNSRKSKSSNISTSEKVDISRKEHSPLSDTDYEVGDTTMSGPGPVRAEPYDWPHAGPLEPTTTALVIIDMQRDFCEDGGYMAFQGYDITPAKNIIPVIKSLLEKFREANYPIYFTREGHRPDLSTLSAREHYRSRNNKKQCGIGDAGPLGRLLVRGEYGHGIIDELCPFEHEPIIDKPGRGAFAHTEFELMLRIKGIKNLVICGVTTDVCVTSTMREANDRRFDCVLVQNACAAGDAGLHDAAVRTIKEEGGIFGSVTTAEELIRALDPDGTQFDSDLNLHSKTFEDAADGTMGQNPFEVPSPPLPNSRAVNGIRVGKFEPSRALPDPLASIDPNDGTSRGPEFRHLPNWHKKGDSGP